MGAFDYDMASDTMGALADTLGTINKINDSEAADVRRQETYDRQKTERQDSQSALGILQGGGEIPEDSNLAPGSISKATGVYANQRKSEDFTRRSKKEEKIDSSLMEIRKKLLGWDGKSIDFVSQLKGENIYEDMAIQRLLPELLENKRFKYEYRQQLAKAAKMDLKEHLDYMEISKKNLGDGNIERAEKNLLRALNEVPFPIDMEKNEDGTFNLFYDEAGEKKEVIESGLTMQQVFEVAESHSDDEKIRSMAVAKSQAHLYNSKVSPVVWSNSKTGERFDIMTYKDPKRPSRFETVIYEHDGAPLPGMTIEMIANGGARKENKVDLGMASKTMDLNRKKLDQLLRPFKNAVDKYGEKISPLTATQQFVSEFDGQKDISPENSQRLQQAKQALSLNDSINQRIGGTYPQPAPPPEVDYFAGAKAAFKDGGAEGVSKFLSGIQDKATRETVAERMRTLVAGQGKPDKDGESDGPGAENSAMDIDTYTTSSDNQGLIDQYGAQTSAMEVGAGAETVASAMGKVGDTMSGIKDIDHSKVQTPNYLSGNYQTNSPASSKTAAKNQVPGKKDYGKRADGTPKGPGFLGELPGPNGTVSTEVSIGVDFDGQETEIPLLVPTLSQEEINAVLKGGQIPDSIIQKAITHAKMRISQGKSPFAEDGEQNANLAMK